MVNYNGEPIGTGGAGTALVSVTEYAAALGLLIADPSTLFTRVEFALAVASDEIRRRTSQTFDLVEGDVIILDGTGHQELLLPQLPVNAVNTVTFDDGLSTELVVTDYKVAPLDGVIRRRKGFPWGFGNVTVDYDHGFTTIPYDLANIAIQSARAGVSAGTPGLTGETTGGYSYTRDATVQAVESFSSLLDLYTVKRIPVP